MISCPSRLAFFSTLLGKDPVSVTGRWFPQYRELGALQIVDSRSEEKQ
jgi:hypothetical protein